MALRITLIVFLVLTVFIGESQNKKLPDDVKITACFRTNSSLVPTDKLIPRVKIRKGNMIVFDYVRDKGYDREVRDKDTSVIADTDFFERVTFAVNPKADSFYYSNDQLKTIKGYYEFYGGESSLAKTDFKIRKGFIKGQKVNGTWIIEALIGATEKQKPGKVIQEIRFAETFKNCN